MKKKTLLLAAVAVMLVATMSIGGMLAYFTDTDGANNTFTVGKVDITLEEEFEQFSKLVPGIDVKKEVKVAAEAGTEDTYVRVHIAIPQILDDGDDTFNAAANTLHFNYPESSVGEGLWNWKKPDGGWNYYEIDMDGVTYNVYVVTYQTALKAGEETPLVMNKVYLDKKVTQEQIADIDEGLLENWNIAIIAEGGQAAGFEDAYTALNTQFGEPSAENSPFNIENEVAPF